VRCRRTPAKVSYAALWAELKNRVEAEVEAEAPGWLKPPRGIRANEAVEDRQADSGGVEPIVQLERISDPGPPTYQSF
jgi:hypothetical protein